MASEEKPQPVWILFEDKSAENPHMYRMFIGVFASSEAAVARMNLYLSQCVVVEGPQGQSTTITGEITNKRKFMIIEYTPEEKSQWG